ncbi:Cytochrome c oxidase subunit 8A, mitochondrial [Hanseniaspora vineae]
MLSQQLIRLSAKRSFTSTMRAQSGVHFQEGVYSNLPFKVKNRKIPYGIIHFGFFALGFAVPFISCFVQLKKSGSI